MSVHSFSSVSKDFASASGQAHIQVFATPDFGLWYSASSSLALHGFLDTDSAGCWLDRKSTSETFQFLGSSLVSWSSRKQSGVAQSTTEEEYVAAASCCSQLFWITHTMSDFGEEYTHVPLQYDSTSAISVTKNPMLHFKTKHIEVSYRFPRDNVEKEKSLRSMYPHMTS
jgi:hypothetical protein